MIFPTTPSGTEEEKSFVALVSPMRFFVMFPGSPNRVPHLWMREFAAPATHIYMLHILAQYPGDQAETKQEEGPQSQFLNRFHRATHYAELPKYN